jgi:acid phosphatase
MKRRNLLKSFALLPTLATPLLSACNPIRDPSDRQPYYKLEIGGDIYGVGDNLLPLTDILPYPDGVEFLNLVVLGDSGEGNAAQVKVADLIAAYHSEFPVDAMLHTGDIIYPDGVQNPTDPQTQTHFEDIYLRSDLEDADGNPIQMYASTGNHDHYGNIQAMVEFATDYSQVLNMPSLYYKINTKELGLPGPEVEVFFIDSYPLIKNRYSHKQLDWLNQELQKSTADKKIFISHHPLRIYGSYEDSKYLKDTLEVLAQEYNVDMCFAGHDHHMQIQQGTNGITYMVSGSGGATLRQSGVGEDSIFSASHFGAIAVQVFSDKIRYIPLMDLNSEFYSEYHFYEV